MEGSEGTPDGPRDVWMRRAGPFYGLLVAARGQTRLPLAPELEPTDADRERGVPWAPAVGAILGLGLGFAAAIFSEIGLAAGVVAALIACLWVVAGGGWPELAAARMGGRFFARGDDEPGDGSSTLVIALVLALAVSLLLRVAALLGIATDYWTEALIVCPLLARATPVARVLTGSLLSMRRSGEGDEPPSLPVTSLIALGVVAAVALVAGGTPGFVALLIAAGAGAGSSLLGTGDGNREAGLVLTIELVALLCFAASDTYPLL